MQATMILATFIASFAVATTPTESEPTVLSAGPVQLSGWEAHQTFRFSTPQHLGNQFVMEIDARASALIDDKRSFLVIHVNGRKVDAKILRRLEAMHVETPLVLEPGEHTIEFTARAVTVDDTCENGARSMAWLDLESIRVAPSPTTATSAKISHRTLDLQLEQWRTSQRGDVGISISHPHSLVQTEDKWRAALALDHLVRDWGQQPRHLADRNSAASNGLRHIDLTLLPLQLPDTGSYRDLQTDLLFRFAPQRRSAVRVVDDTVVIIARDANAVTDLMVVLNDQAFLKRCSGMHFCIVGDQLNRPVVDGDVEADTQKLSLATMGLPYGFTASSAGRQSVRFLFQRPQHWVSTGEGWVELLVSAGRLEAEDNVGITLKAGGRPIVSWDIGNTTDEPHRLLAKIPKRLLADSAVMFDVTLDFPPAPDGCLGEARRPPWAHVESESRVIFPRVENHRRTLANFPDGAPVLHVDVAPDALGDVASHAAALYPIHQNLNSARWMTTNGNATCPSPCVHVLSSRRSAPAGAMFVAMKSNGDTLDASGAQHLPILRDGSVIEVARDGDEQGHMWMRVQATGGSEAIKAPTKESYGVQRALYAGTRWTSGKFEGAVHAIVRVEAEADSTGAAISRATHAQRGFDAAWLIALLVVLAGSLLWLTTTRRRRSR